MIRRPPRSTLFPTRRSSDLSEGNELGLLAAGFNRMAAGLRERERLRDAFGTFVDPDLDRKSTRLNSSHANISYAVFCLKKKKDIYLLAHLSSALIFSPSYVL